MSSKNRWFPGNIAVSGIAVVALALSAALAGSDRFADAQASGDTKAKKATEKKAVEKRETEKKPADSSAKKKDDSKDIEKKPKAPVDPAKSKNGSDSENAKSDPSAVDDDEDGDKSKAAGGKAVAKTLSIDEEYVKENLEAAIHPTKIEWLEDGRVKLMFDFSETKRIPEQDSIFTQKVGNDQRSKFRWTLRYEDGYTGTTSSTRTDSDVSWWYGGLRMGMDGKVFLNCWFTDDVEAELHFAQYISFDPKQLFAFVFAPDPSKAVGSNFGSQAVAFSGGAISKKKGTVDQVLAEHGMKLKIRLREGTCEVFRDGRSKEKLDYPKKSFASGRIGFIWGGGIACICPRLEITGRIDAKKMAQDLRKRK